jgi:hypothetical protein
MLIQVPVAILIKYTHLQYIKSFKKNPDRDGKIMNFAPNVVQLTINQKSDKDSCCQSSSAVYCHLL